MLRCKKVSWMLFVCLSVHLSSNIDMQLGLQSQHTEFLLETLCDSKIFSNAFAAGPPPWTPLGELTTLPQTSYLAPPFSAPAASPLSRLRRSPAGNPPLVFWQIEHCLVMNALRGTRKRHTIASSDRRPVVCLYGCETDRVTNLARSSVCLWPILLMHYSYAVGVFCSVVDRRCLSSSLTDVLWLNGKS